MKTKLKTTAGLLIAALTILSCDGISLISDATLKTESLPVKQSFTSINNTAAFDVSVETGKNLHIEGQGNPGGFEALKLTVANDVLTISNAEKSPLSNSLMNLTIALTELKSYTNESSGDLILKGRYGKLTLDNRDSGDILMTGSSDGLTAVAAGSGDITANDFSVKSADLQLLGSGDMAIRVTGSLEAVLKGSGDLTCYGTPEEIRYDEQGSGKFRRE